MISLKSNGKIIVIENRIRFLRLTIFSDGSAIYEWFYGFCLVFRYRERYNF